MGGRWCVCGGANLYDSICGFYWTVLNNVIRPAHYLQWRALHFHISR